MDRLLVEPADICPGAEYLPLATLILPIIGSSLTGSVSDWQRLLLLGFTLHHLVQFMRCPSGLVRASQAPSFSPSSSLPPTSKAVLLELKSINLLATLALLASPLLAVGFLHLLQLAMGPEQSLLDRFGTRVCVIAVGLRPANYVIQLFRPRQPRASKLTTATQDLEIRIESLSQALARHAELTATSSKLNDLEHHTKVSVDDLDRALNNLTRRRNSALPATIQAHKILAQTTIDLALRTQILMDSVNERLSALVRRQASIPAILLARANKLVTATGTTLQRLGSTLAPPNDHPDYNGYSDSKT